MALLVIAGVTPPLAGRRANKGPAGARFEDGRKMAKSLFEHDKAIANLPGSTPARELLVRRALEYLDGLSHEASDDRSLRRELAEAYQKVGDVQSNPFRANLGDSAGALASYGKALAILAALSAMTSRPVSARAGAATPPSVTWNDGGDDGSRGAELPRGLAIVKQSRLPTDDVDAAHLARSHGPSETTGG